MFSRIGLPELLIILMIILIIFGAKKIPQIAKSLGKVKEEFKKDCNSCSKTKEEKEEKKESQY